MALTEDGSFVSGMGLDFRDFNNDGYPDIAFAALIGQTFPMFQNTGKGSFREITTESGMRGASLQMSGYGAALYDFDNDGWKDLFVSGGHVQSVSLPGQPIDQYNVVFRNPGVSGKWLAQADYIVLVPSDTLVRVRTSTGAVYVQGLSGDLVLQTEIANVEVSDVADAHLQVKTLGGSIKLANIRNCHLDIRSVGGDVTLYNVTGSSGEVNSANGRINYDGDPGSAGDFRLMSHSGDINVSIPASAFVEITSHSVNGKSDQYLPKRDGVSARAPGNLFLKSITDASRFVLHSFKGNIRVSRP